jgi:hypothetical protein
MDAKVPAVAFLALGSIFMISSQQVADAIRWLDKTIWNEQRRKQFPGFGGKDIPRWGVVLLGASWVFSAIILWLVSK